MHTTETANKAAQHADASWVACAGVNITLPSAAKPFEVPIANHNAIL